MVRALSSAWAEIRILPCIEGERAISCAFISRFHAVINLFPRRPTRAAGDFGADDMEDYKNEERPEHKWEDRAPNVTTRWLVIVSVVLFAAAILAVGYAYEQSASVTALNQQNQGMRAVEIQMRGQIETLRTKIDQMIAQQQTDAASAASTARTGGAGASGKSTAKRSASAGSSSQDRRMKQIQSQIAEQKKLLKQTQDDIASARSDLEVKLGSTRDELNGSIARTHDELVTLEKRGERSYYEFDLSKSKGFQREGPIQISLRKADSKHQSYDLMMLVDDHQLAKKKVDLYEPIWLHEADQPQPVQVVVNKIDKNTIHGYVSAARYRESDLASNATQPSADMTSRTIPTPTSTSSSNSSSTTPSANATSSQGQE